MSSKLVHVDTNPILGDVYRYDDDFYTVDISVYRSDNRAEIHVIDIKKKKSITLQPEITISGKDVYLVNSRMKLLLSETEIDTHINFLNAAKIMFKAIKDFVADIV